MYWQQEMHWNLGTNKQLRGLFPSHDFSHARMVVDSSAYVAEAKNSLYLRKNAYTVTMRQPTYFLLFQT